MTSAEDENLFAIIDRRIAALERAVFPREPEQPAAAIEPTPADAPMFTPSAESRARGGESSLPALLTRDQVRQLSEQDLDDELDGGRRLHNDPPDQWRGHIAWRDRVAANVKVLEAEQRKRFSQVPERKTSGART